MSDEGVFLVALLPLDGAEIMGLPGAAHRDTIAVAGLCMGPADTATEAEDHALLILMLTTSTAIA